MFDRDPKEIEVILLGAKYKVEFGVFDTSFRTTVRDTMGDDVTDWRSEWSGWVTVRNLDGERLAACKIRHNCGYKVVRDRIFIPRLIPGREEAYADFIAKKIITVFKADPSKGIPFYHLIPSFPYSYDWKKVLELELKERQELLEAGLIMDEHGQGTLALKE